MTELTTKDEAIKLSEQGQDAIKTFIDGFSKYIEEEDLKAEVFILEQYSKMNVPTLLFNALILRKELEKRSRGSVRK